jgi:hypothetical protein
MSQGIEDGTLGPTSTTDKVGEVNPEIVTTDIIAMTRDREIIGSETTVSIEIVDIGTSQEMDIVGLGVTLETDISDLMTSQGIGI